MEHEYVMLFCILDLCVPIFTEPETSAQAMQAAMCESHTDTHRHVQNEMRIVKIRTNIIIINNIIRIYCNFFPVPMW